MKASDLVIWNKTVAVVIREGGAASSGTLWRVLVGGRVMTAWENELRVISEG